MEDLRREQLESLIGDGVWINCDFGFIWGLLLFDPGEGVQLFLLRLGE